MPAPSQATADRLRLCYIFCCASLVIGLVLSRTLLTVSTIALGALAVAALVLGHRPPRSMLWPALLLMAPLLWLLLGYAQNANSTQWQYLTLTKLPLLVLPAACGVLPHPTPRQQQGVLWCYCLAVALISALTLRQYMLHTAEYHARLLQSREVPVVGGMLHLSFGVLQAFACCACIWLAQGATTARGRWAAWVLAIFLLVCLHVFSSRTGLLCAYAGVAMLTWQLRAQWWPHRQLRRALVVCAVGVAMLAWLLLPTLHNKLHNTWQDVAYYHRGEQLDDWSIGRRLAAWQAAWRVGMAHPLLGVGPADVRDEMAKQYAHMAVRLSPSLYVASHNQYLEALAGMGLPGLLLLLTWLLHGLWHQRRNACFAAAWAILVVAMLTDNLLDYQIGLHWAAFFWCWLWPPTPTRNV